MDAGMCFTIAAGMDVSAMGTQAQIKFRPPCDPHFSRNGYVTEAIFF